MAAGLLAVDDEAQTRYLCWRCGCCFRRRRTSGLRPLQPRAAVEPLDAASTLAATQNLLVPSTTHLSDGPQRRALSSQPRGKPSSTQVISPDAKAAATPSHAASENVTATQDHRLDGRVQQLSGRIGDAVTDLYDVMACLGFGTFGRVSAARDRTSGEEVALKVIPKCVNFPGLFEHLGGALIQKLLAFDHRNVVRYRSFAEDPIAVYVVMELFNGPDLFDFLASRAPLSGPETLEVSGQLLAALRYLHEVAGVVHCDVKPENFIFDTPALNTLKLIDFGSAYALSSPSQEASGTIGFCAPEVFAHGCSFASDVFSAGVIIFNCLTGDWPAPMHREVWQEAEDAEALGIYHTVVMEMAPAAVGHWLDEALPGRRWSPLRELLSLMLHGEPRRRPTAGWACSRLQAAILPKLSGGSHDASTPLLVALRGAEWAASANVDENSWRRYSSRRSDCMVLPRGRTKSSLSPTLSESEASVSGVHLVAPEVRGRMSPKVYNMPAAALRHHNGSFHGGSPIDSDISGVSPAASPTAEASEQATVAVAALAAAVAACGDLDELTSASLSRGSLRAQKSV